jgi:hypothetical protein
LPWQFCPPNNHPNPEAPPPCPEAPPPWVLELPGAFSQALKETMPLIMGDLVTGIKQVCLVLVHNSYSFVIYYYFQNLDLSMQTTVNVLQTLIKSMQANAEKNFETMSTKLAAQTHEQSVRATGLDLSHTSNFYFLQP